jgi:hypothetical protein
MAWRQVAPTSDYVIASERGGRMRPLSIVVWFNRRFKNIIQAVAERIDARQFNPTFPQI